MPCWAGEEGSREAGEAGRRDVVLGRQWGKSWLQDRDGCSRAMMRWPGEM